MGKVIGLREWIKLESNINYSVYLHEKNNKWYMSICGDKDAGIIDAYEVDLDASSIKGQLEEEERKKLNIPGKYLKNKGLEYPHVNGKACARMANSDKDKLYGEINIGRMRLFSRESDIRELPLVIYRRGRKEEMSLFAAVTVGNNGEIMVWDRSDFEKTKAGKQIVEDLESSAKSDYKKGLDTKRDCICESLEQQHYDETIFGILNRDGRNINGVTVRENKWRVSPGEKSPRSSKEPNITQKGNGERGR